MIELVVSIVGKWERWKCVSAPSGGVRGETECDKTTSFHPRQKIVVHEILVTSGPSCGHMWPVQASEGCRQC